MNNPIDPKGYHVTNIVRDDEELNEVPTDDNKSGFKLLITQTKVLFTGENMKKTVLVCFVQFLMYGSCHGLYMFFPEIVDKIETFARENPSNSSSICEILAIESAESENYETSNGICDETIEVATFGFSLITEVLYMIGFLIITFQINKVTKLSILLTILFGCSLSGFLTLFVKVPLVSIYLYIAFMLTFLGVNIVCAATCNMYPTKLRGIAINLTMMSGRIGSVIGTFTVGRILDGYCEVTFGLSAGLMFLCGVLSIFIPNIRHIEGRK